MKSAQNWLVICSIVLTSNACAMGPRRGECESPQLPARPQMEVCLGNLDGSAECIAVDGNNYKRPNLLNMFCTNSRDYIAREEWIKFVLDSCK